MGIEGRKRREEEMKEVVREGAIFSQEERGRLEEEEGG